MNSISGLISSNFKATARYSGIQSWRDDLTQNDGLVVFNEENKAFMGVLTTRDVIERPHTLAIDCLSPKPVLTPDCQVEHALDTMLKYQTNVLPVVDEAGGFTGLVFKNDLLKALWEKKQELRLTLSEEKMITQRQQELLEKAEKILLAMYNSTAEMHFLAAPDYTLLFFNKAAYEQSVAGNGQALQTGDNLAEFLTTTFGQTHGSFAIDFAKALQGSHMVTENMVTWQQRTVWLKTKYYPVYIKGTLAGISVAISDITEKKTTELSLQQQNQLLRDIIFAQSHIVRQPVANMQALIELLDRQQLSEENKEIIDLLQASVIRMDKAIRDIVDKSHAALTDKRIAQPPTAR